MPDALYDTDVLVWSERQADLLRRLARGERLNETIDWENVIEEVESVGRSELRACERLLPQALTRLLKLYLEPGSEAAGHWTDEVAHFLADARGSFAPSMRRRIDVPDLYADAAHRLRLLTRGDPRPALPEACPFGLDDLLVRFPDVTALVGMIAAAAQPQSEAPDA